ncbi:hypothetical protein BDB01DRAFT_852965 [Pilobolus umbonatus]|nr:hypothetical protein BDB01DRAFT_852965 [Pilobolus umbonatus]
MRVHKILLGLSTFIWAVAAIPVFQVVNDFDKNGDQCPLFTHYDVACPLICVRDHSLCPTALAATCSDGQVFCGDGACHSDCSGIDNICQCGDPTVNYVPCASGQVVDIPHFDPVNQVTQVQNMCAADSNATSVNGEWGVSTADAVWLSACVIDYKFTYTEPMWLAVWSLMALEAAILLSWTLYKRFRENKFRQSLSASPSHAMETNEKIELDYKLEADSKMKGKDSSVPSSSYHESLKESEKLKFRGFTNDYFGNFAFGSVVVTTLLFFVFLGVITGDNYGTLTGVVTGVFLESVLIHKIFSAVWHIAAAWFCVIMFFKKSIRNFFRVESYPQKCPYVQVERKQEQLIFLDDGSPWLEKLRKLEQRVTDKFGLDILVTTCPVDVTENKLRFFEYQCMRYVYNSAKGRYEPYEFDLGSSHKQLQGWSNGLSSEEANVRMGLLGENIIRVIVPNIFWGIINEFSSFLYLYQMMCMWVWYFFAYYQMGLVQTAIILISAFIRVFIRHRAENRIKEMAEHESEVTILRDGEWVTLSSGELTPGDVFEVVENTLVPCDAVILSGTVVVNESSLTGEAMPIRKFAIPDDEMTYDGNSTGKVNTLFAGSIVSQITPAITSKKVSRVYALALRTGIATEKGSLIHKILFPSPVSFIFNEHLKVAIGILLIWGLIAFALTLYLMGRGDIVSWFYAIFIMSEIFSPLLPAAFTINQSVCAARLRKKDILCIDLPRINLSGKVRIFCFDKTGTLTREGLEFHGGIASNNGVIGQREEDPLKMDHVMAMGIATCHAVSKVKDQYIGNPVDIESFNSMKWQLLPPAEPEYLDTLVAPACNPSDDKKTVHVIRRFEFVHARASQSVAVLETDTQRVRVFVKGSFERIKNISNPRSVPADYDQQAAKYAQEGCYVLAMAHRDIGILGQDITLEQIKSMTRDELEQDCNFASFILFRNMLKPDTAQAISELKGGDTRVVMITGDTALTGIFVARQCGMIDDHNRIFLGDVVNGAVVWRDVESGEQVDLEDVLAKDNREVFEKRIELAVTGRAFEALVAQNMIRKYLLMIRVFARMTPSDKVTCVQIHMEKGVTAMCGDGGNDCGALRAAHVGLALSEAEASIVSPFSTKNRSVMQCVELLKQGRSALATSFANFKFLILYGECMAFWELIMFYFTAIGSQPVWITIDGIITTTMTLAITQAQPAKKLSPCRPTAKPLGAYTLASLLGVIFINFWFLIASVVWLFQQDWFICREFDSSSINAAYWWLLGDNYEAEVISLVIMFQFFNNAAVVNFGSEFRQSWWRNYILVFLWMAFFVNTSFLTLADPNEFSCIYRINCGSSQALQDLGYPKYDWDIGFFNHPLGHNVLPKWFRWELWGFMVANCACTIIWERICILWIGRHWAIKRKETHPQKNRTVFKL